MTGLHRCIVHIGFHKTGTTSIQRFLKTHREALADIGMHFFRGRHIDDNHVELHAAAMRPERTSSFKQKSGLVLDEAYIERTTREVALFLQAAGDDVALFSAEGLSLLRYVDETERLAKMLPRQVSIIAYLRDRADYLRSHTKQLERTGITTTDKESHAYVGHDTWLTDYDLRLASFRATFGEENVHVVNYDEVCARDGTVISSFLELLGLRAAFPKSDYEMIRLNQS